MNSILVNKALLKIVNPTTLVNMVSQRVRQLNSGGGGMCRPLIDGAEHLSAADIALHEIIEDKIGYDLPEIIELTRAGKRRGRPQGWTNSHPQ
jgi:DNA-directed RNA polymerase subunit K/omega